MIKEFMFGFVVFAAGVGIPIMGAVNAGLGTRLASPVLATVILMLVGLLVATTYMLFQGDRNISRSSDRLNTWLLAH